MTAPQPETIRVNQTVKRITTLGPYQRYGLWVQGCCRCCPGCISVDSQSVEGGRLRDVEDLAREILAVEGIEGITISGGEPFLQDQALASLIRRLRREKDLGVIVYTGYLFQEIAGRELAGLCDVIIDGPYIREKDDGRSLRGSSNQRLILLTDRYSDVLRIGTSGRKTEVCRAEEGTTVMVGVPSRSQAALSEELRSFLKEESL